MRTLPGTIPKGLEQDDVGVPTGVPGFTLRLIAGGAEAAAALTGSGLLERSVDADSPFDAKDLLAMAAARDGFVVLGYYRSGSAGFILGQLNIAGRGKAHLFVRRAWTQGPASWSREAHRFLEGVARQLGCAAVSAVVPPRIARAMRRRYGFDARGVYVVRDLEG